MERKEIITRLSKYFDIQELVCKHTYDKFKNLSWQFLDTEILHTILVLREDILKVGMICNDYKFNGEWTQWKFRMAGISRFLGTMNDRMFMVQNHIFHLKG